VKPAKILSCVAAFLFSGMAWAGIPTDRTVICPVGGEEFTVTSTLSCSVQGRTMSFRPQTSCDFVTRLPVCPGNGLPIYQEFSEGQISELESFLVTQEYASLLTLPPWQRAYGISQHLGEAGTGTAFNLLLNAMWYETDEFLASDVALDQFLTESEDEFQRVPDESKPFLDAIIAYTLSMAGRMEEADVRLDRASEAAGAEEYLQSYISAIKSCQNNMDQQGCRPFEPFNP